LPDGRCLSVETAAPRTTVLRRQTLASVRLIRSIAPREEAGR